MTIKERARAYAEKRCSQWLIPEVNKLITDRCIEQYLEIAEEQRQVDIDKACEWLIKNMPYGYDVEHGTEYEEIDVDDFRKAMMEE